MGRFRKGRAAGQRRRRFDFDAAHLVSPSCRLQLRLLRQEVPVRVRKCCGKTSVPSVRCRRTRRQFGDATVSGCAVDTTPAWSRRTGPATRSAVALMELGGVPGHGPAAQDQQGGDRRAEDAEGDEAAASGPSSAHGRDSSGVADVRPAHEDRRMRLRGRCRGSAAARTRHGRVARSTRVTTLFAPRPDGGIGRHAGLKIRCLRA